MHYKNVKATERQISDGTSKKRFVPLLQSGKLCFA